MVKFVHVVYGLILCESVIVALYFAKILFVLHSADTLIPWTIA